MPDHDELCPQRHQYRGHKSRCVCALLAAARADEREQPTPECDLSIHDAKVEAEVRERLRAQVEALPQHEFLVGSPLAGGGWVQYTAAGVRRSDVLRLLVGESE